MLYLKKYFWVSIRKLVILVLKGILLVSECLDLDFKKRDNKSTKLPHLFHVEFYPNWPTTFRPFPHSLYFDSMSLEVVCFQADCLLMSPIAITVFIDSF